MLELNFDVFWDHFQKQDRLKNQDRRKLHYLEDSNKFTLYLKSAKYWEYFTTITIDKIMEFGGQYEVDREQAVKDFKKSFLHGAMPLKVKEEVVDNLPPVEKKLAPITAEEVKPYADFLEGEFKKWEKQILSFVDVTLSDTLIEKTFGEFMSRLFNVVNTATFRTKLTAAIKCVFIDGIEEAELEIDVDIGFDEDFKNDVEVATSRQLDGFYINGKPWAGLKGVAGDVQKEIRELVVKGIETKSSSKEIKDNIKGTMSKYIGTDVTEGRAMKIARTESNRYRNSAKVKSYEKSGLIGLKRWESFVDDRTSDICKRLDGQEVTLDQSFLDIDTGKSFPHPPSHPSCRSTVSFVLM